MVAKQTAFEEFGSEPEVEKKPRKRILSSRDFDALLKETNALKSSNDWDSFTPKHFVGLYCLLHQHVYGVLPTEVRSQYRQAVGASMRMLHNVFGADCSNMIEFMRWVWKREEFKEQRRDPDSDFRIGWRLQFGAALVNDYQVALARRRSRKRKKA